MAEKEEKMEPERKTASRSEKEGILHFSREMISALVMALVFIVYIIQAFKIPTGSMENSLLVGDFLLGLKFMYGAPVLPFTYLKFPGVVAPGPGDVIIFKYPGTDRKDYIKRCVAGPGQVVQIKGTSLVVDGKTVRLPPHGLHTKNGALFDPYTASLDSGIAWFKPLRIPARGDTIDGGSLPVREALFLKHLIRQEHPRADVRLLLQLYIDGEYDNTVPIRLFRDGSIPFDAVNREKACFQIGQRGPVAVLLNDIDNWKDLNANVEYLKQGLEQSLPGKSIDIRPVIMHDNSIVSKYVVRNDNYFMMGDNRDNSADSRYWGYLNRNFIKARAFILYFSLDRDVPVFLLPLKIRWNRIGKLIRGWDGGAASRA